MPDAATAFRPGDLRIAIIGGSIAGCSAAIELQRLGCEVDVYEQSTADFSERGVGIGAYQQFLELCQQRDLLDADIPCIPFTQRQFVRLGENGSEQRLWHQSMSSTVFTWGQLYANLRKRVDDKHFHSGMRLLDATPRTEDDVALTFSNGQQRECDLVIFADGHDSLGRQLLCPQDAPSYAGYLTWRGVLPESALPYEQEALIAVHPHGHAMCFYVPGDNGSCDLGQRKLTWLWYSLASEAELNSLLEDSDGMQHPSALPPGKLTDGNEALLQQRAEVHLPASFQKMIQATEAPFIQGIFDSAPASYRQGPMLLMGDASALVRPHAGSGAIKAIQQAMDLADCLRTHPSLDTALDQWDAIAVGNGNQQVHLGQQLGQHMVTDTPDWQSMDAADVERWWHEITADQYVYYSDG